MPDKLMEAITSNFGTKMISVIIAVVLWVIVLGSRNVEVTKDVPLEILTPPDLISASEIPEKISFRLAGPKAFLRTILDRREDPIRPNLTSAKPGLVTYRFFSDNIRVPIGVKVLSINPTAILVKLEYLKRKQLPVKIEIRGSLPAGFKLVHTEIVPPQVWIKGAESRVDTLSEIGTVPVDLSKIKQNTEREIELDLTRYNLQLEGPKPKVIVQVEPISAKYSIKNVDVRVLSSFAGTVDEKTVNVQVRALPEALKNLDRASVYGVVDLRGKPKGKYVQPVKVNLPDGVGLVKVIPDKVHVQIK